MPRARPSSTQWNIVCPCEQMRSTGPHASAASANAWPIRVSSRHTSAMSAGFGGSAPATRSRSRPPYGRAPVCSTAPVSTSPSGDQSTIALSIPSWDVPDINPSTRMPTSPLDYLPGSRLALTARRPALGGLRRPARSTATTW